MLARALGGAAMLVLVSRAPLAAQAFGVPVQADGIARGLALEAAIAFPNQAGFGGVAGLAGLSVGARRIGFVGFASGHLDRDDGTELLGGGVATNLKVFGGPLVPFAVMLHGGAAYGSFDGQTAGAERASAWRVPVAVAVSWTFPRPVVAVKPWIAPRLDWTRTRGSDIEGSTVVTERTEPALSAGIVFGFLNGLGIEVSYDRILDGSGSPATFGVGLSYHIR